MSMFDPEYPRNSPPRYPFDNGESEETVKLRAETVDLRQSLHEKDIVLSAQRGESRRAMRKIKVMTQAMVTKENEMKVMTDKLEALKRGKTRDENKIEKMEQELRSMMCIVKDATDEVRKVVAAYSSMENDYSRQLRHVQENARKLQSELEQLRKSSGLAVHRLEKDNEILRTECSALKETRSKMLPKRHVDELYVTNEGLVRSNNELRRQIDALLEDKGSGFIKVENERLRQENAQLQKKSRSMSMSENVRPDARDDFDALQENVILRSRVTELASIVDELVERGHVDGFSSFDRSMLLENRTLLGTIATLRKENRLLKEERSHRDYISSMNDSLIGIAGRIHERSRNDADCDEHVSDGDNIGEDIIPVSSQDIFARYTRVSQENDELREQLERLREDTSFVMGSPRTNLG